MARRRKRLILNAAGKRAEAAERMRAYWATGRSPVRRTMYGEDEPARVESSWLAKGARLIGARIDPPQPVIASGRALAKSTWGRAWCEHLEGYSDFSNRLPRGRTYLRGGRVRHLTIEPGLIQAVVLGSDLYGQSIRIAMLGDERKRSLEERCAGTIEAAVDSDLRPPPEANARVARGSGLGSVPGYERDRSRVQLPRRRVPLQASGGGPLRRRRASRRSTGSVVLAPRDRPGRF